ncbi:MAG: hypothetical protein KAY37_11310 [Phycisphaerae bacterium]|nr:hypothetical protein [Phycisphaerae bacterium]
MLKLGRRGMAVGAACLVMGLLSAVPAQSAYTIDLEWRPLDQTVYVLDPVEIGIFGVYVPDPDDPDPPDVGEIAAAQTIITWDTTYLQLTGSYDDFWTSSGFIPGDSFGFNEADPPADGDGMWTGMLLGDTMDITQEGTLLTTITFQALAETPETLVSILPSLQLPPNPMGYTKVMSGTYNVVGEVGGPAAVEIIPEPASFCLLALGALVLRRRR